MVGGEGVGGGWGGGSRRRGIRHEGVKRMSTPHSIRQSVAASIRRETESSVELISRLPFISCFYGRSRLELVAKCSPSAMTRCKQAELQIFSGKTHPQSGQKLECRRLRTHSLSRFACD